MPTLAQDLRIVDPAEGLRGYGVVTYWSLHGYTSLPALTAAAIRHGLDPRRLPNLPSPADALRRALNDLPLKANRLFARNLRKHGQWAVCREDVDDQNWDGHQLVTCVLVDDELQIRPVVGAPLFQFAGQLQAAFDLAQVSLATPDVSSWLAHEVVEVCRGLPLRQSGGFYYVPPTAMEDWQRIQRVLRTASHHTVYELPAMRSEGVLEAVLDALKAETETSVTSMQADLQQRIGAEALRTRAQQTTRLLAKIEQYETLMGRGQDTLRASCTQLAAQISRALLTAEQAAAAGGAS